MNELKLIKLFNKRVYAFYIDITVVIFFIIVIDSINIKIPLFGFFTFLLFPVFYYNILPLFTKGRTLGLYIMNLKIVYFSSHSKIYFFIINILRMIYSILTLYMFRIFLFPKMNSLGQLNFDEKFSMSIIYEYEKDFPDLDIKKTYYNVNFSPLNFFRIFLYLIIVILFIQFIEYLFE